MSLPESALAGFPALVSWFADKTQRPLFLQEATCSTEAFLCSKVLQMQDGVAQLRLEAPACERARTGLAGCR